MMKFDARRSSVLRDYAEPSVCDRGHSPDPLGTHRAVPKSDIRALRTVELTALLGSNDIPEGLQVTLDASSHRLDSVLESPALAESRGLEERELLAPFCRNGAMYLEMSEIYSTIAAHGSAEARAGDRLVVHEYGSRYLTGNANALSDLPRQTTQKVHPGDSVILGVTSIQNGVAVVLGTMRVFIGPFLGLLDFFEPQTADAADMLEHPGAFECARLALHPVLGIKCGGYADQLRALYRVLVFRELFSSARRLGLGGPGFFIAAPHAARYARDVGVIFERAEGFSSRTCPQAQQTRESFATYWQPLRPRLQPCVYTSELRLKSAAVRVAGIELEVGQGLRTGRRTSATRAASL